MWKPISWTLIVDDFSFKYTNKQHVDELLKIMSQWYLMKMDWGRTIFGGITLKWNYDCERWVELSLPGYIDHEGGCGAQRCGDLRTADCGPCSSVENGGKVRVWGGAVLS